MNLSTSHARRLAIHSQGLDGRWKLPKGTEAAAQTVERLGYVQIDTIAVVERAHHHTIWARCPDYAPAMLDQLLAVDRRVFEGHPRCAAYLPMRDYRYHVPRNRTFAKGDRARRFRQQNAKLVKHVRQRIRDEGPLRSADFDAPPGRRGSWWDWKPAKRALEMLFHSGELMVASRRSFQRMYDLTERVLPKGVDTTPPEPPEMARFILRQALSTHGFARSGDIRLGWRRPDGIDGAIQELLDAGEVTSIRVEGIDDDCYALTATVESITGRRRARRRLHILSPFDSLVIRRRQLEELFGFDYKLECYHPAAKRRWGYFCLPILWGDEFIGRLDAKAERKARILTIRKLMFERGFNDYDAALPPLARKLCAFAAFNQCNDIAIDQTTPRKARALVRRALES